MRPDRRSVRRALPLTLSAVVLAACGLLASPTPTPLASGSPSGSSSRSAGASPSLSGAPSPTPEPTLSLDLPPTTDPRQVAITVTPALTADGGRITVSITNQSPTRIDEIVLRWPTALAATIFLAPFQPSDERVREGGPPLTASTHWTKWVEGPGEQGEPAGTTSLGYGPIDPGTTLDVPLFATRHPAGPVAFDLQLLAGEALLSDPDGRPAEVRVSAP
jgi:hypothetical protein